MRTSRLAPPPHAARLPPSRLHPALRSRRALCKRSSLTNCAKEAYNLYSRRRAGKVYPHEIDIQETHPKHRKLDSQATLSHRARGRAADGLCPQVWPLRASRRDHDPDRLPPWPAGVGGLREGCTFYTSQVRELSFLHSRDVTYAVFCQGPYEESARYRDS